MHLDIINQYFLVIIGWLIQASYQLKCIQCTSPIRHVSQSWDYSCLEGTLTPLPCPEPFNASEPPYKQCKSSLYRLNQRGSAGVLIQRGCTTHEVSQHDCDPPESSGNIDVTSDFYCTRTCTDDGCNRHLVKEISSNANTLLKTKSILMYFIYILFFKYFIFLNI